MATKIRTHVIEVSLDINSNPPVILSVYKKYDVSSGDKIRWVRQTTSQKGQQASPATFIFKPFHPDQSPFENVIYNDDQIECAFWPPEGDPSGTEYEYKITVEQNDQSYTTEPTPSDSGMVEKEDKRPVIRN